MTTIGIIQPCFLPWRGHFHLLHNCDRFVFFDSAQYDRGGWRNRNRIKTQHGLKWISVPIRHDRWPLPIREVQIDNSTPWADKMLRTIRQEYRRAPHFEENFEFLTTSLSRRWDLIGDLDIHLTVEICRRLGFEPSFVRSSDLEVESNDRVGRLVEICRLLRGTRYLSGPTAKAYLDEEPFQKAGMTVEFQSYEGYPSYAQLHGQFEPYVSVIDLLFNCGAQAPSLIWSESAFGATKPA